MVGNWKISIATPEIKVNSGTKTYVDNVINGLGKAGINYTRIAIRKHEISIRGKPYFGFLSQYANAAFKAAKTPVVHSLSPDSIIRGTNIVTVHDIIPIVRKDIYGKNLYDRLVFSKSVERILKIENLLLSTEIGKEEIIETLGVDEQRLNVLHHPINHDLFFPSNKDPYNGTEKIKVLMVSDFNPRKRIDVAIKALMGNQDIDFYHIGPENSWQRIRNEAVDLSSGSKNIHFLGNLSTVKLRDYITYADLFLYLTEAEGFGLPPIEAMACGTNVMVSDISVFHETLADNAFFVNTSEFSAEEVIKAVKVRHRSSELIEYSKRFSIDTYVSGLLNLYKTVGE